MGKTIAVLFPAVATAVVVWLVVAPASLEGWAWVGIGGEVAGFAAWLVLKCGPRRQALTHA